MDEMKLQAIGVIHSPFKQAKGTPIQPKFAAGAEGQVEVFEPFAEALKDLEGFERIWLLYWFDRAGKFRPRVKPFLDKSEHGLFAVRAPCRPNPIGISPVRLIAVEGRILRVADVDILDGTPLLDIKPYAPQFDVFEVTRSGWLDKSSTEQVRADDRFTTEDRQE